MKFLDIETVEYKDDIQTGCIGITNDNQNFYIRVIYDDYNQIHYLAESPSHPELIESIKIFVGKEVLNRTTDKELYKIMRKQYPHMFKNSAYKHISLSEFCKLYMELPEHAHIIQEGRDKNLSFYDILFNNSSVSIIWNKGQSFTKFILEHQHDVVEIEEDIWWGQWAYSIKFSDGTYFTIYSESKIKID